VIADVDVIVVGGGHAGAEACSAAARLGANVLLASSNLETIGQMSCNPAIGGIAKGTIVREVDALGGVMARAADRATIQFRMLNRAKGPAVWAPRAQCDRGLYRRAVRSILEERTGLSFLQTTIRALLIEGRRVVGVTTQDGRTIRSRAVIITAGTFLRGCMHVGTTTRVAGGRAGDPAVVDLAQQLESLGLAVDRFKTGTPPRVDGRTIDYAGLERQDGEMPEYRFGHFELQERPAQRPCWITWAGAEVKEIVQARLYDSALYGGAISGRGPRYCPSVEDKITKFPDVPRHQVFLEPEGLDTAEMYVNGLSTSLPVDVQLAMLHATPGLERVEMTRPGYAIEYDYYPPQQLTPWLELRALESLFFAGQINGTTGYEEAAAQGVVAGINAVRRMRDEEPVVLGRDEAYIGVLADDLVSRGVDEPYRLFTSRAEFRLLLRQDNALKRLAPLAGLLGLLSADEQADVEQRLAAEESLLSAARNTTVRPDLANPVLEAVGERPTDASARIAELVRRPRVSLRQLLEAVGYTGADGAPAESFMSAEIEIRYEGYLARERLAALQLAELAGFHLSADLPYQEMSSLSTEARQKLGMLRPESLARAGRVPGISPSDLQNLVMEVLKRNSAM
jgi:tRNA uridine 5-carboxymethylaminomethyl modification enzyme